MKGAAVLNCKLRVVKVPPDFLMHGRFVMTWLALNFEPLQFNGMHLHKITYIHITLFCWLLDRASQNKNLLP